MNERTAQKWRRQQQQQPRHTNQIRIDRPIQIIGFSARSLILLNATAYFTR